MMHDHFLVKVAGQSGTGHNSSYQWLKGNEAHLQDRILPRKTAIVSGNLLTLLIHYILL